MSGVTATMGSYDFTGQPTQEHDQGSTDDSYGWYPIGAATGSTVDGASYKIKMDKDPNWEFVITNNTGADLVLDAFRFDYARYLNGPQNMEFEYWDGDLDNAVGTDINSFANFVDDVDPNGPGPKDYTDFDWTLTGLNDNVLAHGQSATFRMYFSNPNNIGVAGFLDNVAFTTPDNDNDNDVIPDAIDPDDDNDGLTDVEEGTLGTTDPFDPDSDDDGIIDGLDPDPDTASNSFFCENFDGPLATVLFTQQIATDVTCAATQKITLQPSARVEAGGILRLIAPEVAFDPMTTTIFVEFGGMLTITSEDPTAPIPNPPLP